MDQNNKRKILQKISEMNLKVPVCKKCGGTGLKGVTPWKNECNILDHAWSGEYCDKCDGLGFFLPDENHVLFFCSKCGGKGCDVCNNFGVLDWVENARGRVVNDWYL